MSEDTNFLDDSGTVNEMNGRGPAKSRKLGIKRKIIND